MIYSLFLEKWNSDRCRKAVEKIDEGIEKSTENTEKEIATMSRVRDIEHGLIIL